MFRMLQHSSLIITFRLTNLGVFKILKKPNRMTNSFEPNDKAILIPVYKHVRDCDFPYNLLRIETFRFLWASKGAATVSWVAVGGQIRLSGMVKGLRHTEKYLPWLWPTRTAGCLQDSELPVWRRDKTCFPFSSANWICNWQILWTTQSTIQKQTETIEKLV